MRASKSSDGIILSLFVTLMFYLLIPQTVFCQTEKLGIVQYTPPKGMTKTPKENVVAFSEFNQTTGRFCIITLYGATASSGNPTGNFAAEWNRLVVKNMKAEANPKTDEQKGDGWTAISGGSEAESEVGKAVAFLTVISGFGKSFSVLAVFNDPEYAKQVDAFIGALEMDKPAAPANKTTVAKPTLDSDGNLIIPLPTRQLTVADLAGEWGEESGLISTTYVDRYSGDYAGSDHLAFRSKMTITANGGYFNDFYEVRNGKKFADKTTGTVTITGRVLSIKENGSTSKFVVRGWLELPEMTIMIICGPLNDNDLIRHIENPLQGANLNNTWVRKK